MKNVESIYPPNALGWLEVKLDDNEMDYLWDLVKNSNKKSFKNHLAGNISNSYALVDRGDWFYKNTLAKCCNYYASYFENIGINSPVVKKCNYVLHGFWANIQKQTEFNPLHDHTGVYSFVIFMQIPTHHEDQKKLPIAVDSNSEVISNLSFEYNNIIGNRVGYNYLMSPKMEGSMLFFPSRLQHIVYPYYNCNKERITISGNILLDNGLSEDANPDVRQDRK